MQSKDDGSAAAAAGADHPPPRRAPHADDACAPRSRRCARSATTPPPASTARCAIPTRRRARKTQDRGRPADPDRQGVVHRPRRRDRLDRRAGPRRHGLHRGDRRRPALARRAHRCRSTRAPTASRRATWSAARSPRTAARPCWAWSPRCAPPAEELKAAPGDDLAAIRAGVVAAADALEDATKWVAQSVKGELVSALAGSVPFLRLAGTALGGWLLARSALVAQGKLRRPRRRSRLPRGQADHRPLLRRGDPAPGAGPARPAQGRRPHGVRAHGGAALRRHILFYPGNIDGYILPG